MFIYVGCSREVERDDDEAVYIYVALYTRESVCGVNADELQKVYVKKVHMTFFEKIRWRRVEKACVMFAHDDEKERCRWDGRLIDSLPEVDLVLYTRGC